MKKLIAAWALLSCALNTHANTMQTFSINPCASQVVTIDRNSLNTKQFATQISLGKDGCGLKKATLTLVPRCTPCAAPVVIAPMAYNPCAIPVVAAPMACDPCRLDTPLCAL